MESKPQLSVCNKKAGGESGIRTHVTLSSKHAFQACAFSHSAISPANVLRWEAGWEVGGWRDRRASRTSCSILWMSPQNRNLIRLAKPNLAKAPSGFLSQMK